MPEVPVGAIRTVKQAEALLAKAPINIYRVSRFAIHKGVHVRKLGYDSKIKRDGRSLFLIYVVPREDGTLCPGAIDLNEELNTFLFENYWHAWAFLQKLKALK